MPSEEKLGTDRQQGREHRQPPSDTVGMGATESGREHSLNVPGYEML
jgi:hypothetical protein